MDCLTWAVPHQDPKAEGLPNIVYCSTQPADALRYSGSANLTMREAVVERCSAMDDLSIASLCLVKHIVAVVHISETGRWLLTGEHIVRDAVCCSKLCWKYSDFTRKLKLGAGSYVPSSGLLASATSARGHRAGAGGGHQTKI